MFYSSYKETKEEMNNYEKLKDIKNEDFRVEQEYMNEKAIGGPPTSRSISSPRKVIFLSGSIGNI